MQPRPSRACLHACGILSRRTLKYIGLSREVWTRDGRLVDSSAVPGRQQRCVDVFEQRGGLLLATRRDEADGVVVPGPTAEAEAAAAEAEADALAKAEALAKATAALGSLRSALDQARRNALRCTGDQVPNYAKDAKVARLLRDAGAR